MVILWHRKRCHTELKLLQDLTPTDDIHTVRQRIEIGTEVTAINGVDLTITVLVVPHRQDAACHIIQIIEGDDARRGIISDIRQRFVGRQLRCLCRVVPTEVGLGIGVTEHRDIECIRIQITRSWNRSPRKLLR